MNDDERPSIPSSISSLNHLFYPSSMSLNLCYIIILFVIKTEKRNTTSAIFELFLCMKSRYVPLKEKKNTVLENRSQMSYRIKLF